MAEIVNLRRERKRRARQQSDTSAAENRVKFGRTKAEQDTEARDKARLAQVLNNAKVEK